MSHRLNFKFDYLFITLMILTVSPLDNLPSCTFTPATFCLSNGNSAIIIPLPSSRSFLNMASILSTTSINHPRVRKSDYKSGKLLFRFVTIYRHFIDFNIKPIIKAPQDLANMTSFSVISPIPCCTTLILSLMVSIIASSVPAVSALIIIGTF